MFTKNNNYELLAADERSETDYIRHRRFKLLYTENKALFTASAALLFSLTLNLLLSVYVLQTKSLSLPRSSSLDTESRYGIYRCDHLDTALTFHQPISRETFSCQLSAAHRTARII